MADETRTVAVSLQLIYDPRSARAFQQMATESAKASAAANKAVTSEFAKRQQALGLVGGTAANLGAYGTANTIGRVGSFAQGLDALGMSGAAKFAQRAALPLAIANQLGEAGKSIAGAAYDRYSTNEQIGRRLVRDLVPFGEKVQGYVDAFSGREAGYMQAEISSQNRQAEAQARIQRSQFALTQNPTQAGREALAGAFRGQNAVTAGVYNRFTSSGELAYRDEQRLLPLKQAEAKAERDAAEAAAKRSAAAGEFNRITARTNELTKERQKLERDLNKEENQSGVERQNVLKQIADKNKELDAMISQRQQAAGALNEANTQAVGASAEKQKAIARRKLLGQAEQLESRVETAAGKAEQLGGMNEFDRQYGLEMARAITQAGTTEGFAPDQIAAAEAFAPNAIRNIKIKTGRSSEQFQQGFKEFGALDFGTLDLEGDSKKAQELRKQLGETEFKIDSGSAALIAKYGADFGKFMAETFGQMLEKAKSEILNTVRLGVNQK